MTTDALVSRVAARYQAAKPRGFIPDAWFRSKKAELRAILQRHALKPDDVAYNIETYVIGFFKRFAEDFKELGVHDQAVQSIRGRVEMVVASLDIAKDGHQAFADAVSGAWVKAVSPAEHQIAGHVATHISEMWEKKFKTLGDALDQFWVTHTDRIWGLGASALKKATPTEVEALEKLSADDLDNMYIHAAYGFYQRVVDSKIKGLIEKKDVHGGPTPKWFMDLESMLDANYSERALKDTGHFREFDLYGMKIVVDDNTVSTGEVSKYIKYLDEAYARLKAKGLEHAWYGNVFIRCKECGGVNQHGKDLGVAGDYHIGRDTVQIYSRPSEFVVEMMAHELGHRFWFRSMSQAQRGKFESLIKVHPYKKPEGNFYEPRYISKEKLLNAWHMVDALREGVQMAVLDFKTSRLRWFADVIKKFETPLYQAGREFSTKIYDATGSLGTNAHITPETKRLFEEMQAAAKALYDHLWGMEKTLKDKIHAYPDGTDWNAAFRKERDVWIKETNVLLDAAVKTAHIFMEAVTEAHNADEKDRADPDRPLKQWQKKVDEDPREITPVSDYGKSNIDEAFAEVFAHYVLNKDMSRDQLESFKSVLRKASLAERVAARYLHFFDNL